MERSKETELNANQRTSKENRPAVAIADYTNKPNNNNIPWHHLEDDNSINEVNSSDDNDRETTPTNATVPHRPTPPPLTKLTLAASLPKTPMDYANNPVMLMANH
jgi:hypothetical protein